MNLKLFLLTILLVEITFPRLNFFLASPASFINGHNKFRREVHYSIQEGDQNQSLLPIFVLNNKSLPGTYSPQSFILYPRKMVCLQCFSTERLSNDDFKGRYGGVYSQFANNSRTYDVSMCQGKVTTAVYISLWIFFSILLFYLLIYYFFLLIHYAIITMAISPMR